MNKNAGSRNVVANGIHSWVMVLLSGLLVFSASAQAALINLSSPPPDIFSGNINTNYVAASDTLTAIGTALTIDDDGIGPQIPITSGGFNLSATINDAGIATGGTLSISGTVAVLGFNGGTLLTGTLATVAEAQAQGFTSNFGFPDAGGDPLEFLFVVTGGDAAGLYQAKNPLAGVILNGSGFSSFTSDFSATLGTSDTSAVPLPAAVWLFGSGLFALMGVSSRRRRS